MNKTENVTVGKPKIKGAIYRADLGTEVPVSAKTQLSEDFKCLGYIDEKGVTNKEDREVADITAWGGDVIGAIQKKKKDTFKFTLVEALNVDTLKAVYGKDNVTGELANEVTIKSNNAQPVEGVWAIDMVLKGNHLKRIVIPKGVVSEVGEIEYKDEDLIKYEVTIIGILDSAGNTHYEYMAKGE